MVQQIKKAAISWPVCILSVLWLALFAQTETAARLHGMMWPVTSPIQVTSVTPESINGLPGSRIKGVATIKREQCDYIDVEWQLHGSEKSVNVTAFFLDPAKVRTGGRQVWEALMVGVPPHKLNGTTGAVHHECGSFPVMTPFFSPDESIVPTSVGASARCADSAYTTSTGPGTCSGHGGVERWME